MYLSFLCFSCHCSLSFLQLQCQKNEIISSSSQMVFSFHKNCVIWMYVSYITICLFCVIHYSLFRVLVKRNYNLPYFSFIKLYFSSFLRKEKREKWMFRFHCLKKKEIGTMKWKEKKRKRRKKEKLEKRQFDSSFLLFTFFCIDYKWSFLNSSPLVNT